MSEMCRTRIPPFEIGADWRVVYARTVPSTICSRPARRSSMRSVASRAEPRSFGASASEPEYVGSENAPGRNETVSRVRQAATVTTDDAVAVPTSRQRVRNTRSASTVPPISAETSTCAA
jgi:hypothetical protein